MSPNNELPPLPEEIQRAKDNYGLISPDRATKLLQDYARAAIAAQASNNSVVEVERLRGSLRDSINRMNAGDTSHFSPETKELAERAAQSLAAQAVGQSEQAPVRPQNCGTGYCSCIECHFEAPVRQPLSGEELRDLARSLGTSNCDYIRRHWQPCVLFARAIEAAHGITAQGGAQ